MTNDQIIELMDKLASKAESLPHGGNAKPLLLDAATVIGVQRDTLIEAERRIKALEIQVEAILATEATEMPHDTPF